MTFNAKNHRFTKKLEEIKIKQTDFENIKMVTIKDALKTNKDAIESYLNFQDHMHDSYINIFSNVYDSLKEQADHSNQQYNEFNNYFDTLGNIHNNFTDPI